MALSKKKIKIIKITTYLSIFVLSMLYLNKDKLHIINSQNNTPTTSISNRISEKDTIAIDTLITIENRPHTGEIKF